MEDSEEKEWELELDITCVGGFLIHPPLNSAAARRVFIRERVNG